MPTETFEIIQNEDRLKKKSTKNGISETLKITFGGESSDGFKIKLTVEATPEQIRTKFGSWPMGTNNKFKIAIEPDLAETSTADAMKNVKEIENDSESKEAIKSLENLD